MKILERVQQVSPFVHTSLPSLMLMHSFSGFTAALNVCLMSPRTTAHALKGKLDKMTVALHKGENLSGLQM